MTLESTIRKMQVQWIEESIDFDNLIESLDEGIKPKAIPTGRMKAVHALVAKGMSPADIAKKMGMDVKTIEALMDDVELDEAKYDLYHKDFSTAMQHAYKMAKKMYGITVDPEEIDDKVASGPRKPSEGKTNKYRLKGDKGAIQIQVYNKGGSKPFELNMYKEENEEGYKPVKNDHYDVKVTVSDKDVDKVKSFIMNSPQYNRGDIEDVDSDQVDGGGQAFRGKGDIFIQGDDAGKLGVEIAKKFRGVKVMGEGLSLIHI